MNAIIICPCCRHWVLASLLDSLAAAPAPPTDPVKSEFPKQNFQKNYQTRHRQRSAPRAGNGRTSVNAAYPVKIEFPKANSQTEIGQAKARAESARCSAPPISIWLNRGRRSAMKRKEMLNAEVECYRQRASAGSTRHHQLTTYYQPPAFQRAAIVRTRSPAACRRRGAIR